MELIKKVIIAKDVRVPAYLKACTCVDLIIYDHSATYSTVSRDKACTLLGRGLHETLCLTQFREIFLITTIEDFGVACIPLKGSLLASEVFGLLHACKSIAVDGLKTADIIHGFLRKRELQAAVWQSETSIEVAFGAWKITFSPEVEVNDMTHTPPLPLRDIWH
jgi:hypothetical protein